MEHVSKSFGQVQAVSDLSVQIPQGQIVGLLGVNGAGKSTTLNMLTGCMPPTTGQIQIGGMDLFQHATAARRLMGYLPEHPPLYPEMTVQEYLVFVCRLKEVEKRAIPRHIDEIVHLCGLSEVRARLLGQLSKGYRQRAGLAQAICGSPEVLVLDEPTIGLDPRQVAEIRQLIRNLGEKHTVVFSSHILSEVQEICQRAVILHRGKMLRDVSLADGSEMEQACNVRVQVLGCAETVVPAVRSLPCVQRVRMESRDGNLSTTMQVTLSQDMEAFGARKELFRLFCALDTPMVMMESAKNTLEDIFLQATREEVAQ